MSEANRGLYNEEDVGDKPQNGMRGLKVGESIFVLVDLDDDEAGDESSEREVIQRSVSISSLLLLLCCMGWLKDQGSLCEEHESGGVE